MHNIKDIRSNFENFKNIIKSRNISINLDQILDLDQNNRKLIQEKETLEQEKKVYQKNKTNHCLQNLKKFQKKFYLSTKNNL